MYTLATGDELGLNTLVRPLHVYDAKKICGKLNTGHGPYLWCALSKDGKEAWFWFIPRENVSMDEFEVAFITEGEADDPDTQEVVWPNEMRDESLDQVYKTVYKNFISK